MSPNAGGIDIVPRARTSGLSPPPCWDFEEEEEGEEKEKQKGKEKEKEKDIAVDVEGGWQVTKPAPRQQLKEKTNIVEATPQLIPTLKRPVPQATEEGKENDPPSEPKRRKLVAVIAPL